MYIHCKAIFQVQLQVLGGLLNFALYFASKEDVTRRVSSYGEKSNCIETWSISSVRYFFGGEKVIYTKVILALGAMHIVVVTASNFTASFFRTLKFNLDLSYLIICWIFGGVGFVKSTAAVSSFFLEERIDDTGAKLLIFETAHSSNNMATHLHFWF